MAKTVNAYIVYYLDAWSKIPFNSFKLKISFFDSSDIVWNSDKEKWVYNDYGIVTIDRAGLYNFCDDFGKNAVIFGIDNSSSSNTDNCKNSLLVLGVVLVDGINGSFEQRKSLVLTSINERENFA